MQALWIIVASAMFALMSFCVKLSTAYVDLPLIVVMRGLPSALIIGVWIVYQRKSFIPQHKLSHVKRNLSGVSSLWLSYYATSVLPLATSTTLNYTAPIFIAIWLVFWQKAYTDHFRVATVVIGFLGVLTILRPSVGSDQIVASIIGLVSGGLAAIAYLQIGQLGKTGEPGWRIVFYFSVSVTLTGLIALCFLPWTTPPLSSLLPLLGVGIFGLLGQLTLTQAFTQGSTILSATLQYTTILFAVTIEYFAWQHLPDMIAWIGIALIITAGLVSTWRTMTTQRKQGAIK